MVNVQQLAAFIYRNNTGIQKCGYAGSTLADIVDDLEEGLKESSVLLYEGDEISAAVLLDIYEAGEDGQCDIEVWGPFSKDSDAGRIRQLLDSLQTAASEQATRYIHFFVSGENRPFLDVLGASDAFSMLKETGHYHYSADLSVSLPLVHNSSLSYIAMTGPESGLLELLKGLHDAAFPDAILTKEDIAAELKRSPHSEYDLYSILDEGCFTGYAIVRRNGITSTIHLEYLGVTPGARGRGTGRQIIGFLAETYRKRQFNSMKLVVSENNPAAIRLYERLDFCRDSAMQHIIVSK
ncbi:putative acetyltransferase [compost metagenome]